MEQKIIANEVALVGIFMQDVRAIAPLSKEDELEIAKQARSGDLASLERLIGSNLGWVIRAANQYWRPGLSRLDLISEGALGLMIAARKFDPDRGLRFITYADHWIRSRIGSVVKVHGRHEVFSLDNPIDSGDTKTTFKDLLESEQAPPAETENRHLVKTMLSGLGPKELQVIEMHYWQDLSFVEIGKRLGISGTRARQIGARSLRKMRWSSNGRSGADHRLPLSFVDFTGLKA